MENIVTSFESKKEEGLLPFFFHEILKNTVKA